MAIIGTFSKWFLFYAKEKPIKITAEAVGRIILLQKSLLKLPSNSHTHTYIYIYKTFN